MNYSFSGIYETNKFWWINIDINTDALRPATCFEPNYGPIYMFARRLSSILFALKPKEHMT